jgi:peptide/nickel transport system substrate-binding protein
VDNMMKKALRLGISDPEEALALWTKIDHTITDDAPLAVLLNPRQINFLSKRVGNFVWSAQFYMMFAKAWVQ